MTESRSEPNGCAFLIMVLLLFFVAVKIDRVQHVVEDLERRLVRGGVIAVENEEPQ